MSFGALPARLLILILFTLASVDLTAAAANEWKPVTPEELKMASIPEAPDAPAVCLFSEVFTDDVTGHEHHYIRIKVLTDGGRSQGNIEIPYVKGYWDLKNVKARTVRPDGSSIDYSGVPADQQIVRARGFKFLAKTFALADVQSGSIIEYQYDLQWYNGMVFSDPWVVEGDLFTVRASFTRRPTRTLNLRFYPSRLPTGVDPQVGSDGLIRLELKNVAASHWEDFMPPEAETRPRVDFYYYSGTALGTDMEKIWTLVAKAARESIDHYISKDREIGRVLAEAVTPDDNPEKQVRKLYARVQALRNLSFELEKTRQEDKREKTKLSEYVGDVVKHGYGGRYELDLLFFALARRAGFEATPLALAQRDGTSFFDPRALSLASLPGRAILLKVNGHDYFLDPGTPFLPFGWLRWGETSVKALRLDTTNGGFLMTPDYAAADSAVERKAVFNLNETGGLEGIVTITYLGLEAFNRRFDARELDEVARRHMLETELQQWIPATAEVQLQNQPEWSRPEPSLSAEFSVRVSNWASTTAHRLLCPIGVFSGGERGLFQSEQRMHDLYFHFPLEARDTISITLPAHFRVDALPAEQHRDLGFLSYKTLAVSETKTLQISRRLTLGRILVPTSVYPGVRAFYQSLRSADDSLAVLVPEASSASR